MRTLLTILTLTAAMFTVAGCGSGSSKTGSTSGGLTNAGTTTPATTITPTTTTSSTTGPSSGSPGKALTAAALVARADAICRRLNDELVAAKDEIRTTQDIVRIAPQRVAVEQTALHELSKLTPPTAMAGAYEQTLASRRTLIEDTTKLGQYAATNNTKVGPSLFAATTATVRQMGATARSIGLVDCGRLGG
jgi:hypothetical protein